MSHAGLASVLGPILQDFKSLVTEIPQIEGNKEFESRKAFEAYYVGKPGILSSYSALPPLLRDEDNALSFRILKAALDDGIEIAMLPRLNTYEFEYAIIFKTPEDLTAFQLKYM